MKKFQDTIGDFKKYYCEKLKRNYWVLGYFGGGSMSVSDIQKIASEYQKETSLPLESIRIDEILSSRRFKGFKFLFSDAENQNPLPDSQKSENVYAFLRD